MLISSRNGDVGEEVAEVSISEVATAVIDHDMYQQLYNHLFVWASGSSR